MILSALLVPEWPLGWWRHLRAQEVPHLPPLFWPLGFVGLVGLLHRRTPQGRALAAMTVVPVSTMGYDLLMPWLVPSTAREALTLTLSAWVAVALLLHTGPHDLVRPWTVGDLILTLGLIAPCAWMVWRSSDVPTASIPAPSPAGRASESLKTSQTT